MPTYIDASQLAPEEELISDEEKNPFSHVAHRGTLTSEPGRSFFIKKVENEREANLEVLAQEFFRLIIPYQPETRTAELVEVAAGDPTKKTYLYYVLSEEVKGYRLLPERESVHFGDGTYKGLGQAVVCAMFLQEIDLKNMNIGLDESGRVVKIDGDWCFAPQREGDRFSRCSYTITPEGIESLPFPDGFYAFNWLDAINNGVLRVRSRLIAPE